MAGKKTEKSVGRPSDYRPEYCQTVIDLGRQGASKAEMAFAIGVTRQTLDNWSARHPEFFVAVKDAIDLAQGWWEQKGREATFGGSPGFNATAYIFQMKNRFSADWRDRQEHRHAGAIGTYDLSKMSDDELDRLEAILGPLALASGDQGGEGEAEG